MHVFDRDVTQTMKFDIVDQYNLRVECFNHDLLEGDTMIGTAECSLLPAFKRGKLKARPIKMKDHCCFSETTNPRMRLDNIYTFSSAAAGCNNRRDHGYVDRAHRLPRLWYAETGRRHPLHAVLRGATRTCVSSAPA